MRDLELLAPARNAQIGIAAVDCGADAVYVAGPAFGARHAAGNSVEDIRALCSYAHKFGARVFVTVNTIIYDAELDGLRRLLVELVDAGADALIVQDMAVAAIAGETGLRIPLHASTQCAIRTTSKARDLAGAGFSRLILERELPLSVIRSIAEAVPECEIECFVHGALCVCYSGNCYLSQELAGRSANRGECAQPCRSLYDLEDSSGKTIVRNKALLSLKDFNLIGRIPELASAGVTSFKIEGRLKNESYVRNVVRAYSLALDLFIKANPEEYRRASYGQVTHSFEPSLEKTFNRGYTSLFIDGKRGEWACMDAPKGMGEIIGTVKSAVAGKSIVIGTEREVKLTNGDGLSFVNRKGQVEGFRADNCSGLTVSGNIPSGIFKGAVLWRNLDTAFEKQIAANPGRRLLSVILDIETSASSVIVRAEREDGAVIAKQFALPGNETARDAARMESLIRSQLSKTSGNLSFSVRSLRLSSTPLLPAALINSWRREIAGELESVPVAPRPLLLRKLSPESLKYSGPDLGSSRQARGTTAGDSPANVVQNGFRDNIANSVASQLYGREISSPEIVGTGGIELMRTRYCVRHELGICPRRHQEVSSPEATADATPQRNGEKPGNADSLFLVNQGRRLELRFDCPRCEMTVILPGRRKN